MHPTNRQTTYHKNTSKIVLRAMRQPVKNDSIPQTCSRLFISGSIFFRYDSVISSVGRPLIRAMFVKHLAHSASRPELASQRGDSIMYLAKTYTPHSVSERIREKHESNEELFVFRDENRMVQVKNGWQEIAGNSRDKRCQRSL